MKILIIGGTGLIGDKILSNLNLKRHKVFSINRKKILHHPNITYFKLNYYKEFSKIKKIIEKYKFEVVINLICFNYSQAKRDFNLFKDFKIIEINHLQDNNIQKKYTSAFWYVVVKKNN